MIVQWSHGVFLSWGECSIVIVCIFIVMTEVAWPFCSHLSVTICNCGAIEAHSLTRLGQIA